MGGFTPTSGTSSVLNRPTTAFRRVLEKIPGLGVLTTSPESPKITSPGIFVPKSTKKGTVLAHSLQARIDKVVRSEIKAIATRTNLIKELEDWATLLPLLESQDLVREFAALLEAQKLTQLDRGEKLENIKLYLTHVSERERKYSELFATRAKIIKLLKECQARYGSTASNSILLEEHLEENTYNIEVVGMQLGRMVTSKLREAFATYLVCLQTTSDDLTAAADKYFQRLLRMEGHDLPKRLTLNDLEIYTNKRVNKQKETSAPNPSRISVDLGVANENQLSREHTPYTLGEHENYRANMLDGDERWGSS